MSKYKKIMLDKGVMQKDILDNVRRVDKRIDKSPPAQQAPTAINKTQKDKGKGYRLF